MTGEGELKPSKSAGDWQEVFPCVDRGLEPHVDLASVYSTSYWSDKLDELRLPSRSSITLTPMVFRRVLGRILTTHGEDPRLMTVLQHLPRGQVRGSCAGPDASRRQSVVELHEVQLLLNWIIYGGMKCPRDR